MSLVCGCIVSLSKSYAVLLSMSSVSGCMMLLNEWLHDDVEKVVA